MEVRLVEDGGGEDDGGDVGEREAHGGGEVGRMRLVEVRMVEVMLVKRV